MARILQVCNTDFYLSRFLKPLVVALAEHGHEVDCVCDGNDIDHAGFGQGIGFHAFEYPRTSSPLQFAAATRRMQRLIRAGRYDCVDSHNRNASIVARIAAWRERVPVNLYTAHGFYFHDDQSPAAHRATVWLESMLARITDYTLSQSTEDTAFVIERGIISPDRIEHIGNGIDTGRFSPRRDRAQLEQDLGLAAGRFRVCSTGRLVRGKGFGDLLDAFAILRATVPEAELLMIGGNISQDISPYQEEFTARVAALGLSDAVRVTGLIDRVEDYLATCDLFVLPSYREGLPRSLLEAMAMGLCAVATDIRGCREVIQHGESGLLFEPRDTSTLARLMLELHRSPGQRARFAANGRARVHAHFDEAGYVQRQVAAINRLLLTPGRDNCPA